MFFGSIYRYFSRRWSAPCGYRELLMFAIPLILSTGLWSVQFFVDRMFLTWYSEEAIAAAMPAGILNFSLTSLFVGTASYVGTFVAQYWGAGEHRKIGAVVWQGIYLSALGGVVLLALIPLARPFFTWTGHAPLVRENEIVYFQVLCLGGFPAIASAALSGFFSGRGNTRPVLYVDIFATCVNVTLNYLLIFGNHGFPSLGIVGAGIGTVATGVCSTSLFFFLMIRPAKRRQFATLEHCRIDFPLLGRILRFGLPSGVQFFIDTAGFSIVTLLIGLLGTAELAASNIAFNINSLAFMPMIGLGIAVSALVGQNIGRGDIARAEYTAWSGFHITFLYMGTVVFFYVLVPGFFLAPFAAYSDSGSFGKIYDISIVLLRFVALYSLFDAMNIIFSSAIKGAGDTRFVMVMIIFYSAFVLVLPCWIAIRMHADIYVLWIIITVYACLLGISFLLRFLSGKWKTMRVIESSAYFVSPVPPPAKAIE